MTRPEGIPQDVWDAAREPSEKAYLAFYCDEAQTIIARAIMAAKAEEREAAAIDGWNACRRSIYAVCEDVAEEYDQHRSDTENGPRHHFGRGGMSAAKSIARGFNSMEALDDDNLTAAIRQRGEVNTAHKNSEG